MDMIDLSHADNQIQSVTNFKDLVSKPFKGQNNALYWPRELKGDFSEIVKNIELNDTIIELEEE